jgi:hypothetical protein
MEATHSLFHAETSDRSQSFNFSAKAKPKSDNEHIGYALRQVQLVAIYLRPPSALLPHQTLSIKIITTAHRPKTRKAAYDVRA